jgi:hypothetical protein
MPGEVKEQITYRVSTRITVKYLDLENPENEGGFYERSPRAVARVTTGSKDRARAMFERAVRAQFPGCWSLDMGRITVKEVSPNDPSSD